MSSRDDLDVGKQQEVEHDSPPAILRTADDVQSEAESAGETEHSQATEGAMEEAVGALAGDEHLQNEGARKTSNVGRQRFLNTLGRGLLMAGRTIMHSSGRPVTVVEHTSSRPDPARKQIMEPVHEEEEGEDVVVEAARWSRRRDIPLAIIAWAFVAYLFLWAIGHVGKTILVLVIAALLAYALAPAVGLFQRFMPRVVSVLIVYLIVLGGIGTLLFFVVSTAVQQVNSLAHNINDLLRSGQLDPFFKRLGIADPVGTLLNEVGRQAQGAAGNVVPVLSGVLDTIVDVILVAVLSIYFLIDGSRVMNWLRWNTPRRQRGRMRFAMDTLQRVVGGYIRGQLLLCSIIGVLVGGGMAVMQIPYALLLGVLAFILEFIPILGTLASGAICVLLALTKGWFWAVLVLVYFIIVHILEGDIIGPRVVGKAVGLHPIVAMAALIAGAELFGVWGALFGSPVAGIIQALLIAIWVEWRELHPQEFQYAKRKAADLAVGDPSHEAELPRDPTGRLLS